MLSLLITNARRTGDLINMTVKEFENAHSSRSDTNDHVVFVKDHKTKRGKRCRVNFFASLYVYAGHYVTAFGSKYLRTAIPRKGARVQDEGLMFPNVGHGKGQRWMDQRTFNRRINIAWKRCVHSSFNCCL